MKLEKTKPSKVYYGPTRYDRSKFTLSVIKRYSMVDV